MYNTLSNIVSSVSSFGSLISSCLSDNYVQYFFSVNVERNFTNNTLYYTVYLERLHYAWQFDYHDGKSEYNGDFK